MLLPAPALSRLVAEAEFVRFLLCAGSPKGGQGHEGDSGDCCNLEVHRKAAAPAAALQAAPAAVPLSDWCS